MELSAGSFSVDEYTVHIYTDDDAVSQLLVEARLRGRPLVSTYSYRLDPSRDGTGLSHLHIYARRKEIFAINRDGTAHDDSHGVRIPNKVADALRTAFPDWTFPRDNIIESLFPTALHTILVESAVAGRAEGQS